jgi:hypothetical protein
MNFVFVSLLVKIGCSFLIDSSGIRSDKIIQITLNILLEFSEVSRKAKPSRGKSNKTTSMPHNLKYNIINKIKKQYKLKR